MKTMKTPFKQMLAAVPADIQQEVDLELAISNRINDLMMQRGLTKLEFALARCYAMRPRKKRSGLNFQDALFVVLSGDFIIHELRINTCRVLLDCS